MSTYSFLIGFFLSWEFEFVKELRYFPGLIVFFTSFLITREVRKLRGKSFFFSIMMSETLNLLDG
jgi:hypothetical protein